MAHTFDTKNRIFRNVNPATIEITPTSGATVLVLGIVVYGSTGRTGGAPTFNGDTLTQVGTVETATESNVEMWYLADPSIGTYDVSLPNTNSRNMYIVASVYKAQAGHTSTLDVTNQDSTLSANPSISVTTTEDGDVLVDVLGDGYSVNPSDNSDILLYSTDNGAMSDNHQYALQGSAGGKTLSWVCGSDDWAMIVSAFKEVAAPITGHPWFYERKQ